MNSSFSFSRFGVISRIKRPRCSVWRGGSNDGNWSLNIRPSRYWSMIGLMSSPSSGTGHCAQSHLAKAAITLHQTDDGPAFDLYTRRSFADYLWRWLEDAAREYGLAIVRP